MQRSWTPFCLVPGVKGVPPSHCVPSPGSTSLSSPARNPRSRGRRSGLFHRRQSQRNPKRMPLERWPAECRVLEVAKRCVERETNGDGGIARRLSTRCGSIVSLCCTRSSVDRGSPVFRHVEHAFVLRYSVVSLCPSVFPLSS